MSPADFEETTRLSADPETGYTIPMSETAQPNGRRDQGWPNCSGPSRACLFRCSTVYVPDKDKND